MVRLVKNWVLGSTFIGAVACLIVLGMWFVPDATELGFVWTMVIVVTLVAAYIAVIAIAEAYCLWRAAREKHHDSEPA